MLVIRLARTGKKHQAYYRVVVADSRKAVGAKFIEILGNYDPHLKKFNIIKKDRLEHYLKNGAQPSNTVAKLLVREKIELPKWVKIEEKKRAPKLAPAEAAGKTAEVVAEAPKSEDETADKPAESEDTEEKKPTEEGAKGSVVPDETQKVEEPKKETEEPAEEKGKDLESNESIAEPEVKDKE